MKKQIKKRHQVNMHIDNELYLKSKNIIANRTTDYEDYLRRRLNSKNRLEMLRKERDEVIDRLKVLDKEIEDEIMFKRDIEIVELEYEQVLDKAVGTLVKMFEIHGFLGINNIENVASINDLNFNELKNRLPKSIKLKLVDSLEIENIPGKIQGVDY